MIEAEYWLDLEMRVTAEFAGIDECRRLGLWCDGFIPDAYHLQEAQARVEGTAWICAGEEQQPWRFTLLLPHGVPSLEAIDWAALLPGDDVTRWLHLDFERRHLEMEPGVAVEEASQPTDPTDGPSGRR